MEEEDVKLETKLFVIENELQLWKNTAYQSELRARVGKRAENKQFEETAMKQLEEALRMIDEYKKELELLKEKKDATETK